MRKRRRSSVGAGLLALLLVGLLTIATAQANAATGPAGAVRATPAAFVPDWDGHTDATTIDFVVRTRSSVVVRIIDARGRSVRLLTRGVRRAGTHTVSWDGRRANGRVLAPGRYRVQVTARRVASRRTARGLLRSAAVGAASVQRAAVTISAPEVALTGVELSRPALGRSGTAARMNVRYALSTSAAVSAAVVDARGRSVRTLVAGARPDGISSVTWNGRTDRGELADDGSYELVIAASGPGRPTDTQRVPLTVDRVAPKLSVPARVQARVTRGSLTIPVKVTVAEPTTVTVRYARRSVQHKVEPGTHTVSVSGSELGLRSAARRTRTVTVHVSARDVAGNATTLRRKVTVRPTPKQPAKPKTPAKPTPPAPAPPVTKVPPIGTAPPGALPWPTSGVVTSEFGMRDGRPHTGIDIADPTGTPIHPVAAGTVSFVGVLGGYGNLVIVEHSSGLRTYYAHMSKFGGFAVGASVTHADVLGLVGCTGSCTGPHVHFETRINNVPKDPRGYLRPR